MRGVYRLEGVTIYPQRTVDQCGGSQLSSSSILLFQRRNPKMPHDSRWKSRRDLRGFCENKRLAVLFSRNRHTVPCRSRTANWWSLTSRSPYNFRNIHTAGVRNRRTSQHPSPVYKTIKPDAPDSTHSIGCTGSERITSLPGTAGARQRKPWFDSPNRLPSAVLTPWVSLVARASASTVRSRREVYSTSTCSESAAPSPDMTIMRTPVKSATHP